jgi:hypothetical protein
VLELYDAREGWTFEIVADLGSGMSDHKQGLKKQPNQAVVGVDWSPSAYATDEKIFGSRADARLKLNCGESSNTFVVILSGMLIPWSPNRNKTPRRIAQPQARIARIRANLLY